MNITCKVNITKKKGYNMSGELRVDTILSSSNDDYVEVKENLVVEGKVTIEGDSSAIGTDGEEKSAATKGVVKSYVNNRVPPGAIMIWSMEVPPDGWFECNSDWLQIGEYNDLYLAVGKTYGYNQVGNSFRLPDYRGFFLRGWDHDNPVPNDPNSGSRLDRGDGVAGNFVGTKQNDEFKEHAHSTVQMIGNNSIDGVDSTTTYSGEHHNESRFTGDEGGSETRPKNINVMFIIKC